jgi:hypothetical protein
LTAPEPDSGFTISITGLHSPGETPKVELSGIEKSEAPLIPALVFRQAFARVRAREVLHFVDRL